jgi:hypothetical protein
MEPDIEVRKEKKTNWREGILDNRFTNIKAEIGIRSTEGYKNIEK